MATELTVKLNNTLNGTSLKAVQDNNGNDITQTYFRGGTLKADTIKRNLDSSSLRLYSSTNQTNGASLILHSKDYDNQAKSSFVLIASDGTQQADFVGRPDGTLKWIGKDLAGTVIVAKSLGVNGYIKYASGLIIQWGKNEPTIANTVTEISFPISFTTNRTINITTEAIEHSQPITNLIFLTKSLFRTICSIDKATVHWVAIGS